MDKVAYTILFIAGVCLFFLTADDNLFAGAVAGVMWGLSIFGLVRKT